MSSSEPVCGPPRQVLFSSITALLGAPGQANYCAANAALDSMAASAQATGVAVVSVQWGAWSGAGMAAKVRQPLYGMVLMQKRCALQTAIPQHVAQR